MLQKIENLINFILDSTGKIATLLLIVLVGVISYNVIGRYAFNSSSIALEELAWHLYSSVFLLGISYAVRTSSHVRVDLIYDLMKPRTQAYIDIIGTCIFMLPLAALVLFFGSDFAYQSYSFGPHADSISGLIHQFFTSGIGERSQDPGGLNNRWVIKSVIPLAFLLLMLSAVSVLINRVRFLCAHPVDTAGTPLCSADNGDIK